MEAEEAENENVEVEGVVIYRHPHAVQAIACSNLESETNIWVASANSIGQIALVDLNYADETSHSLVQWAHCTSITALAMSQNIISSAAADGSLNLWDARLKLQAGQIGSNRDGLRRSYERNDSVFEVDTCSSLQFGASGSERLFVGTSSGSVFLFDLRQTHQPLMQFKVRNVSHFAHCFSASKLANSDRMDHRRCDHYRHTP
jgi:WD40 repeat protein